MQTLLKIDPFWMMNLKFTKSNMWGWIITQRAQDVGTTQKFGCKYVDTSQHDVNVILTFYKRLFNIGQQILMYVTFIHGWLYDVDGRPHLWTQHWPLPQRRFISCCWSNSETDNVIAKLLKRQESTQIIQLHFQRWFKVMTMLVQGLINVSNFARCT